MMMKHTHSMKGFTLIETLVAITILMVILVAPFKTAENALTSSYVARDELIANSLAQEAAEYLHGIRGNDYLVVYGGGTANWMQGVDGSAGTPNCFSPALCTIDAAPSAAVHIAQCYAGSGGNTCPTLPLYTTSGGLYTQVATNNTITRFYRTIQLCYIGGAKCSTPTTEVKTIVTVTWTTSHQAYSTQVIDYLTNWL